MAKLACDLEEGHGRQMVSYEDAVVEALRFGWTDSVARTLDDSRTMLWFGRPPPGPTGRPSPSAQHADLLWIAQAKRPETRRRRVEETASRSARNQRL